MFGLTILPKPYLQQHRLPVRFLQIFRILFAQKNYFDIFGLPVSYDVSMDYLTPKYRELLKRVHPDKFHQKTTAEKEHSETNSRLINQAYRTLQNPLQRGLHVLELKNSPLHENQLDVSSDVLMEVYETNEELADIQDPTRLAKIKADNDKKTADLVRQVSTAFRENRVDDAKKLLAKMKYYTTIEERIRLIELEMGVVR